MRSKWVFVVGALAFALVLAACGGMQADQTPTPSFGNPTATPKPTATPLPTPIPATAAAPSGGAAPTGDNVVTADEKDFAIALDKAQMKAGSVIIYVKNAGPSPHNVQIMGGGVMKVSETINANATTQFTVDLKPGTYSVICNISGHEQLGMKTTLTVQ